MPRRPSSSSRRAAVRRRVKISLAITVPLLALIGWGAWVGARGLQAQSELEQAIPIASQIRGALTSGDTETTIALADQLADHTQAATSLTSDPLWRGAEVIPVVGDDLAAVRIAANATNELAQKALVPASQISIDSFKPVDGRIDIESVRSVVGLVDTAQTTIDASYDSVSTIDRSKLFDVVDGGVGQLVDQLTEAKSLIDGVSTAAQLIPSALGGDGPRNYLLMFQNNAESRGTGGNPAALVLLNVDNGAITIGRQAGSQEFYNSWTRDPVAPLDPETENIYGAMIARYIQNISLTPDFPETAALAQAFWQEQFDDEISGVVSFDPIALGYLLNATGPITLPTGEQITSENAVSLLLSDVYQRYEDPEDQDAFFAAAAAGIFGAVTSGSGDIRGLVDQLARATGEGRLMLWSADPAEAKLIRDSGSRLDGVLPVDNAERTVIGAYFNDTTQSKMSYYVDSTVEVHQATCGADKQYLVRVTLTNNVPGNYDDLPGYVTGEGVFYPVGDIASDVVVYGPVGGVTESWSADGVAVASISQGSHLGRPVVRMSAVFEPGESHTFGYKMTIPEAAAPGPTEVWGTPMVRPTSTVVVDDLVCE